MVCCSMAWPFANMLFSPRLKLNTAIRTNSVEQSTHLFVTELIGLMMMTLALKRRRRKSRSYRLQMTSTPKNKP